MSLDIDKMKGYQAPPATPFMEFLAPVKQGKTETFFAYLIEAVGEPVPHEGKDMDGNPKPERLQIFRVVEVKPEGYAIPRLKSKPEEYIEVGRQYKANLTKHKPLWTNFERLLPLDGKRMAVMNRGLKRGKTGKPYTDYVVMLSEGEMQAHQMVFYEE